MLTKLFYWLFTVKVALCDCHTERKKSGFVRAKNQYKISKIATLPAYIAETSGLARHSTPNTYWTHNDGGNAAELFAIDSVGAVQARLALPQLTNTDWEDLAQDQQGNLYIADIGNNANNRRDLQIFKINPSRPQNVEKISFIYNNQVAYPPPLNARNFDCEALVFHQEKLYLFSKNRSPLNRFVKMYVLPALAGQYTAIAQDSIYIKSMITGADISPDGRTLALLSYGKVLLFDLVAGNVNFDQPSACIKIGRGQAEAILFINNTDFIFTNEYHRHLYKVTKKER
jgi:hypothetical protein